MNAILREYIPKLEKDLRALEALAQVAQETDFVIWTAGAMCVDPHGDLGKPISVGVRHAPTYSANDAYRMARRFVNLGQRCKAISRPEAIQREMNALHECLQNLRAMRDEPQEASQ